MCPDRTGLIRQAVGSCSETIVFALASSFSYANILRLYSHLDKRPCSKFSFTKSKISFVILKFCSHARIVQWNFCFFRSIFISQTYWSNVSNFPYCAQHGILLLSKSSIWLVESLLPSPFIVMYLFHRTLLEHSWWSSWKGVYHGSLQGSVPRI